MSKAHGIYKRPNSPNWFYRFDFNGKEYRRSTGTPDRVEAAKIRDRVRRQLRASNGLPEGINIGWDERCRLAFEDRQSWMHKMRRSIQRRNRRLFNRRHGLTIDELFHLARNSNGICEISSLPFEFAQDKPVNGPFAISIDRIIAKEPYDLMNCRLVLRGVNYAMNAWGEDAFWQIANAAVGQRLIIR